LFTNRQNMNFGFWKKKSVQIIADYVYFHMTYHIYIWNHAGWHKSVLNMTHFQLFAWFGQTVLEVSSGPCLNVSTTPLRQWGFWQCLPFSWTTLRGKHCWHPIAVMGDVDTFGPCALPKFLSATRCKVSTRQKMSRKTDFQ
jgi:hypothetical protein